MERETAGGESGTPQVGEEGKGSKSSVAATASDQPLAEEIILVPLSKLKLLTQGKKSSAQNLISKFTNTQIRKQPKSTPAAATGEDAMEVSNDVMSSFRVDHPQRE